MEPVKKPRSAGLRRSAMRLPDKPGIYFFKGAGGETLYIGKARSLRERVKSYFQAARDPKIQNILAETTDLDFILTDSEKEATLLENNYVQRLQPKFNLKLKDDKSFPYLKITVRDRIPAVVLSRRVEPDGARYFGPYSPARQARKTIRLLNRFFGLRACEEKIPGSRRRPCLEYDLKCCSAPCTAFISEEEYQKNVRNALLFLEGRTDELRKALKERMEEASARREYEQAAHWRDSLKTIAEIRQKPRLTSPVLEDEDIIGLARREGEAAAFIFIRRKGKVRQSAAFRFRADVSLKDQDVLAEFLERFYRETMDIPGRILLPLEPARSRVLAGVLKPFRGKKVEWLVPRRGERKKTLDLAQNNAENLLQRSPAAPSSLLEAQRVLDLDSPPVHIEGFDISNTGGLETVGSSVVFRDGRPENREFRRYIVRSVEGPNDVAGLREIIRRRFRRLLDENRPLPGLVLVDGGKGQLGAAEDALVELGLENVPVISLAKKEERIFSAKHKEGFLLDRTSPALKLFQHIRDEAHRFAVSLHRKRRTKRSFASFLDGIAGIGPKKKTTLLARFTSLESLRDADPEELRDMVGAGPAAEIKKIIAREENNDGHGNRN